MTGLLTCFRPFHYLSKVFLVSVSSFTSFFQALLPCLVYPTSSAAVQSSFPSNNHWDTRIVFFLSGFCSGLVTGCLILQEKLITTDDCMKELKQPKINRQKQQGKKGQSAPDFGSNSLKLSVKLFLCTKKINLLIQTELQL